jgi:hypothetical protein
MKFTSFNIIPCPGYAIEGEGEDEVGQFKLEDIGSQDGEVRWKKNYIGQHTIFYQGVVDTNPMMVRGHWGFAPGWKNGQF